jgi:hypothetical protein
MFGCGYLVLLSMDATENDSPPQLEQIWLLQLEEPWLIG